MIVTTEKGTQSFICCCPDILAIFDEKRKMEMKNFDVIEILLPAPPSLLPELGDRRRGGGGVVELCALKSKTPMIAHFLVVAYRF